MGVCIYYGTKPIAFTEIHEVCCANSMDNDVVCMSFQEPRNGDYFAYVEINKGGSNFFEGRFEELRPSYLPIAGWDKEIKEFCRKWSLEITKIGWWVCGVDNDN